MENNLFQSDATSLPQIQLETQAESFLKTAAKWAKFLAIVSFIGIGFVLLLGIFFLFAGSIFLNNFTRNPLLAIASGSPAILGILYILLAVLYFFPTYYMFKFSTEVPQGIRQQDAIQLTRGFENLKSYFKFNGIMVIVIISLYVLALIGVLITAIGMSNSY